MHFLVIDVLSIPLLFGTQPDEYYRSRSMSACPHRTVQPQGISRGSINQLPFPPPSCSAGILSVEGVQSPPPPNLPQSRLPHDLPFSLVIVVLLRPTPVHFASEAAIPDTRAVHSFFLSYLFFRPPSSLCTFFSTTRPPSQTGIPVVCRPMPCSPIPFGHGSFFFYNGL